MVTVPALRLNDGNEIPQFGFGVFQVKPEQTADTVKLAIESGYRHIDTAQMYRNEREVGEGIARSTVDRDGIFVTTKLNNDRHGATEPVDALNESLERLGTDHVDLFLIHWPRPKEGKYVPTWQAFEKLAADRRTRSIGVSNFQVHHLDDLAGASGTVPAVNQIELHPYLQQPELRQYHREHGILTEAWSPIAQGAVLDDPVLREIAAGHGRSVAQVVLRWHIQLGNIVFPKSTTPDRIRENIDVFDFELTDEDMGAIGGLDRGERTGPDPDDFG
jgi:2,5-diketo-D-gluconate reductase A